MARFSYSAMDRSGGFVTGELSAESDIAASDQIARRGLTLVSLGPAGSDVPWWQRDISLFGDARELRLDQQSQFFGDLETMLAAGFPITRALDFAAKQARDAKTKRLLSRLSDQVEGGSTLANAMEESGGFQARLVGLIDMGERANQLERVSSSIAQMLEVEIGNRTQLRQALMYPAILLVMSILVILMLVFFLAPTLVPVFQSADVEPPVLLKALEGFGRLMREQWMLILGGSITLLIVVVAFRSALSQSFRSFLSVLPGIKGYFRAQHTLRFAQTMHLMLGSGARLPMALTAAAETASSPAWRSGIETIRSQVEAGESLVVALRSSTLMDDSALTFVEAGETGDQLEQMLAQCATFLEGRIQAQLANALKLLTPLLTLIIGLTVGLLIFTTIGAILDLNDLAV